MDRSSLIEVVEYDPAWPQQFERIAADLATALTAVPVVAIEHVGSTSVPGLAAKPVIDVDVVVAREHVDIAIDALEAVGYRPLGTMGIDDRHAFREPDPPLRNVYVVVDGCLALRNHLGARDVLRADPTLRDEYGALKRRLATQFTYEQIDEYVAAKTPVLARALAAAGMAPDEVRQIADDNRS